MLTTKAMIAALALAAAPLAAQTANNATETAPPAAAAGNAVLPVTDNAVLPVTGNATAPATTAEMLPPEQADPLNPSDFAYGEPRTEPDRNRFPWGLLGLVGLLGLLPRRKDHLKA